MSSLRKAAVILMSLPQEEAGKVMSLLTPKQVEAVSIEIAKLSRLTSEEQESTIREFATTNPRAMAGELGGLDKAKALVEKALGKNAGATLDNVQQSIEALPIPKICSPLSSMNTRRRSRSFCRTCRRLTALKLSADCPPSGNYR
jgi:flagellar motor switch protein FliG